MGLLNLSRVNVGEVGVLPGSVKMVSTDSLATITTAGYLNGISNGSIILGVQLAPSDLIECLYSYTVSSGTGSYAMLKPSISNGVITLSGVNDGDVVLPTIANRAVYATDINGTLSTASGVSISNGGNIAAGLSGTAGYLASFPSTAAKGSLRLTGVANTGDTLVTISNALHGQASVVSIPDGGQATANFILSESAGGQTISSGGLIVADGNIQSGSSGDAGSVISYPATAANGTLILAAANAGGAFNTTISNAVSVGQSQVISIPDSGAATANFLLSTGAANIIAKQEFLGLSEVLTFGTGTWTVTRIAQGNYVSRHTPGNETSIIAVDITPAIVIAASKGFRLDSFDVIYAIAANALDAHSAVLDRIVYSNNVAVSVTSVPITVTLATATQANPYVTNAVIDTPAFAVAADTKYVLEISVNNAAASEYDYYGLMLRFSQTIA